MAASGPWIPLEAADSRGLGGKAAGLQRLVRAGLPVPPAWVLPTAVFEAFLREAGLWDAALAGDDARLHAEIPTVSPRFSLPCPAPSVAVRSSAQDEDGQRRSAAGQYATVLGVGPEGITDAVRACWASLYAPRAAAYRGGAAAPASMTVLAMQMVDARAAGVLFTIDPVSGSWSDLIIEAVWGLGDSLVGGRMVPDRYVVRRARVPARYAASRVAGWIGVRSPLEVSAERVAEQRVALRVARGGTEEHATEAPLARKLVRGEVLALARLGLRAESRLGGPQDLEWAQDRAGTFWVLQARPVTTRAAVPRGASTLWSRRFLGERWPEGATPLGWSVVGPLLERFVAYPATTARYLGGDPPFRLVRGHPYVNVTVFRHLAFKVPGAPPPRFLLDLFPPAEVALWGARAAVPPDVRVYASILRETLHERRWRRFRWNPLTNPAAWRTFVAELDARLARLDAAAPEVAVDIANPILFDYLKIHITSLLFANVAFEVLSPRVGPRVAEVVLRPPSGSATVAVNGALWDAGRDPTRLDALLARHGHRSAAGWELWSVRWAEDPDAVRALAAVVAAGVDPRLAAREEEEVASRRIAELDPSLAASVRLARSYLGLREEQRWHLDRVMWSLKKRLRLLGERGAREGWLAGPEDVRWLTAGELAAHRDGTLTAQEVRAQVERRRAEPPDPEPPTWIEGDAALAVPTDAANRFQGLGISPGIFRGRARVVRGPADADRLRAGEILVARATDPGWTPMYSRAGAVVLELGSQLSHGAIVAREYGVPGVVNIDGATRLFPDGTELTVDGRAGAVWKHAPP